MATMGSEERILVYSSFKDRVVTLAKDLQCPSYYGFYKDDPMWKDMDQKAALELDGQNKADTMDGYRNGDHKVLVATSALSAGYDYPHIHQVYATSRPDAMLDLVQELHRAGRDGQPSTAWLMPAEPMSCATPKGEDLEGTAASYKMFYSPDGQCLRFIMSQFCDGEGQMCSEVPGAQRCSVCVANQTPGK
jgi:superfamily II DNA helicase RecQ